MLYVITGGCFFVQNKTKEDGECLNLLSCYKRYTNNCYVFASKQEITIPTSLLIPKHNNLFLSVDEL